jgi:DNA repair exonuclease SbcCD ATPase subunit
MASNNTIEMRKRYNEMEKSLRKVESQLAQAGRDKDQAVTEAFVTARRQSAAEREELVAQHVARTTELEAHAEHLQAHRNQLAALLEADRQSLEEAARQLLRAQEQSSKQAARIRELEEQVAAMRPALHEVESVNAELAARLTKVADRMRKREKAEVSALLNRRAAAQALFVVESSVEEEEVEPEGPCAACGGELKSLGALGARNHWRCVRCGTDQSGIPLAHVTPKAPSQGARLAKGS